MSPYLSHHNLDLARLYGQYVPDVGDCESHGGECIRAMNYIANRFEEAHLYFNIRFGSSSVGPVATFLSECTDEDIKHCIRNQSIIFTEDDNQYRDFLNELSILVMSYAQCNYETKFKCAMFDVGNIFLDETQEWCDEEHDGE